MKKDTEYTRLKKFRNEKTLNISLISKGMVGV